MTTLKVKNYSLVVFETANTETPLFESYEIARLLGYSQAGSLRKQTLTDWKNQMSAGSHYEMVHDVHVLRRYEEEHEEAGNGSLKPTSSARGRLFFTPTGLLHVLNRSSKKSEDLRSALTREGYFDKVGGMAMVVKDVTGINVPRQFIMGKPCHRCDRPLDANEDCPCTPAPRVSAKRIPLNTVPAAPPPARSKEERMFEYEVIQNLLGQLERLTDPQLRGLAITAAEIALGRELKDLRFGEGAKTILGGVIAAPKKAAAPAPKPRLSTEGPFFKDNDFYSMTRIGQMAGGYTAKTAGVAVDLVGKRLGYAKDQLRNEQLPINEVSLRPDSSTGKKRPMVRFSRDFSNKVIIELRTNPELEPTLTQGIPTLSPFGGARTGPILSRGPFDEDDATQSSPRS